MKKAMVFGAGISGKGAKMLLESMGYTVLLVDDRIGMSSSEGMEHLSEIEIFIKSPGTPYTDLVKRAKELEIEVMDEIELGYRYMKSMQMPTKIIAITGTNGKTTTTTKIKELLEFAGKKVKCAGNVGYSYAETLLENRDLEYIVLELSSYQLENVKEFKADIAMVINLAPDHLDRYAKVEDYYDAKFNIANNQREEDSFILNLACPESLKRADKITGTIYRVALDKRAENQNVHVANGDLYFQGEKILEAEKLSLKGKHNLENTLFIVTTGKILGLSSETIEKFLYNTESLEHRMEGFFNYGKVSFVNDSKGTNIESTKFAVEAYKNPILICGGVDKKLDLNPLIDLIISNVKEVYLIGEIRGKIEGMLLARGYSEKRIYNCETIENAVKILKDKLNRDTEDVVLLSPTTASFDQFKNYVERGRRFKQIVLENFSEGAK